MRGFLKADIFITHAGRVVAASSVEFMRAMVSQCLMNLASFAIEPSEHTRALKKRRLAVPLF